MKSSTTMIKAICLCCLFTTMISNSVFADDSKFDIGLRGNVEIADGTPANDILGQGIYGIFNLNSEWGVGVGLDVYSYDLENPSKLVSIKSANPKVIDAKTSSTMISAWGERYYSDVFESSIITVNAAIGINQIDVDNATGPVQGGGTWNIKTDVGTDVVLFGGVGIKYPFTKNWTFDSDIGANIHFGKWELQDLNSSSKHTIDGFNSWSLQFGVSRSF